jgi:hypothetical protein
MSAIGCGFPTEFAGERLACGTRLAGFGDVAAILCPACQNMQRLQSQRWALETRPCVNCQEPTSDTLCGPCADEVRRDLAESDQPEPGEPGSRCTWRSCGYCGRCGGA